MSACTNNEYYSFNIILYKQASTCIIFCHAALYRPGNNLRAFQVNKKHHLRINLNLYFVNFIIYLGPFAWCVRMWSCQVAESQSRWVFSLRLCGNNNILNMWQWHKRAHTSHTLHTSHKEARGAAPLLPISCMGHTMIIHYTLLLCSVCSVWYWFFSFFFFLFKLNIRNAAKTWPSYCDLFYINPLVPKLVTAANRIMKNDGRFTAKRLFWNKFARLLCCARQSRMRIYHANGQRDEVKHTN